MQQCRDEGQALSGEELTLVAASGSLGGAAGQG